MNKVVKELLTRRGQEEAFRGKMYKVWIGNVMVVTSNLYNMYAIYGDKITEYEEI